MDKNLKGFEENKIALWTTTTEHYNEAHRTIKFFEIVLCIYLS